MTEKELMERYALSESYRKIIIGSVAGMQIDSAYKLNIPSIHAFNEQGEFVMDFNGNLRETKGNVDEIQIQEVRNWVVENKKKIELNIRKINHGAKPDLIQ